MRRILPFAVFAFLFSPSIAFAVVCPAGVCNPATTICSSCSCDPQQIGATKMDNDRKNLIACLLNDSGSSVWKSFTGGVAAGTTTPPVAQQYYCPWGDTNNNTCAATCNHQPGGAGVSCVTWHHVIQNGVMVGKCGAVQCNSY